MAYRGEGGGVRRPHVLAGVVGEPKQQAGQEELRVPGGVVVDWNLSFNMLSGVRTFCLLRCAQKETKKRACTHMTHSERQMQMVVMDT